MKLLILLSAIQFSRSFDVAHDNCSEAVHIDGAWYDLTHTWLMEDAFAKDAHFDWMGNLFYVQTKRLPDGYAFDAFVIKHDSMTPEQILGLPDGQAYSIAIDYMQSDVFFATERGLYTYDYKTNTAVADEFNNEHINMVFVDGDSNKYIAKPDNGVDELYLVENISHIPVHKIGYISDLAINDDNDIYFIKENRLFVLKHNKHAPEYVIDVKYAGIGQITFNENETLFIATDELRYLAKNSVQIKELRFPYGDISAMAFDDKGTVIIGFNGRLLKYEKVKCIFNS